MNRPRKGNRNRWGGLGADASDPPGVTSTRRHRRDVLRGRGPRDRLRVAQGAGRGLGPDARCSEGRQVRRPEVGATVLAHGAHGAGPPRGRAHWG